MSRILVSGLINIETTMLARLTRTAVNSIPTVNQASVAMRELRVSHSMV